jgi:hypothetical protein
MNSTRVALPKVRMAVPIALVAGSLSVLACFHLAGTRAATTVSGQAAQAAAVPPVPVLVELFTSEGCSSCPPADALLAKLDAKQPVAGAQAIVLSEHVTYWNEGGWRDPFSDEIFTDRQQQYVARMGLQSPYTPQVVVDGTADVLGSDAAALVRSLTRAAATPKPQLTIESPVWQGDVVHFAVRVANPIHAPLMAALASDATQSSVARGENAGRTLHHVAVVRVLKNMGNGAADGRPLTLKLGGDTGAGKSNPMRLVVFLIDSHSGKVQAIAEAPLTR